MEKFKEEIFNYLTQKDNYITACDMKNHLQEVNVELITQFWKLVKDRIEEILKEKNKNWTVEIDDVTKTFSEVKVEVVKDFYVAYEQLSLVPYYGIWVDNRKQIYNRDEIDIYFSDNITKITNELKTQWWLGRAYKGINFDEPKDLQRILPDIRDGLAIDFAENIIEIAIHEETHIIAMSDMKI